MTRAQFLNDLYRLLAGNGMNAEQAEQHLTYYAEMLADRMEEGMSENQAVSSMEDVDTIARRVLEEEGLPYRPLREIPMKPPAAPDVSPGRGRRAYQARRSGAGGSWPRPPCGPWPSPSPWAPPAAGCGSGTSGTMPPPTTRHRPRSRWRNLPPTPPTPNGTIATAGRPPITTATSTAAA